MRRHLYIVLFSIVALIGLAAFAAGYRQAKARLAVNTMPTDSIGAVDGSEENIPHADPALVGHWISTAKPGWHKVYYDDYDEEQHLFWGKEWDEAEDVHEYDLRFHGNGWFRWTRKENTIHEFATMDNRDVPIHHAYTIDYTGPDSVVYHDSHYFRLIYRFVRLQP